jgi:hypothetical protein
MTDRAEPGPREAIPPEWQRGMAIAAALEAAHFSCDSGEDVDRLIEMLYQRGYEITALRRECEHRRATPCVDRNGSCGTHLSPWVAPATGEGAESE